MTRHGVDRLWTHSIYLAEFTMHGNTPDEDCPYARIAVPNRRPYAGEVFDWCRETWGPSTKLRPNPEGGPDLRRPDARWALVKIPSCTWRILYRGLLVFDMGDAAMLQLRFSIRWNAGGLARSFWRDDRPAMMISDVARHLLGLDGAAEP